MREILFRGKRHYNNEWVYGNLVYDNQNKPHIVEKEVVEEDGHHIIIDSDTPMFFIDETIGQYTGLTDKNGTKIFEGDIITTDIARPYLIVGFRDGCFVVNCNDGEEDYYDIMLPILDKPHTQYLYGEVIGNIHDNPELLKEREQ